VNARALSHLYAALPLDFWLGAKLAPKSQIDAPIDTAEKRLQAWAGVCVGGSINLARAGDALYTWDAHPRRLKNGALEGRVYAQRRGEVFRDAGGFKIAGDGTVAKVPAALRAVLPGALEASAEDQPEPMNGDEHG
jgi:hypothetical protein